MAVGEGEGAGKEVATMAVPTSQRLTDFLALLTKKKRWRKLVKKTLSGRGEERKKRKKKKREGVSGVCTCTRLPSLMASMGAANQLSSCVLLATVEVVVRSPNSVIYIF